MHVVQKMMLILLPQTSSCNTSELLFALSASQFESHVPCFFEAKLDTSMNNGLSTHTRCIQNHGK